MRKVLITVLLIFFLGTFVYGKPWRGIIPLHSTRADVERILGKPNGKYGRYELKDEWAEIFYSTGRCVNGWNVPEGTVISIAVSPTRQLRISDLRIDVSKYHRFRDPHVTTHVLYTNREEGMQYVVVDNKSETNGLVLTIYHQSTIEDERRLYCRKSEHRSKDKTPFQSPPPQTNETSDLINSGLFDNNLKALKAWLKFIEDGNYRAAKGEDFKFSEAAKSRLRRMFGDGWFPRINYPANINRRLEFHDLAVIVVNTKRNDSARFGLVIFRIEPNKEQIASAHWLFQNRDLSSSLLSWHSNWPVLVFYEDDGSADPYYINWNENTQQYFLDKQQIGPGARPGRLREKSGKKSST